MSYSFERFVRGVQVYIDKDSARISQNLTFVK